MQKNWLGLLMVVMAVEVAALLVCVIVWLPRQLQVAKPEAVPAPATDLEERLVGVENQLAQINQRLTILSKKNGDTQLNREFQDIKSHLEDLGTLIYSFKQNNQKNLMRMQKNIMRRFSAINPSGASAVPTDPATLDAWLSTRGVSIDRDRGELSFEGLIASPDRPLELVCGTIGGPLHETLLEAKCTPSAIHAGLKALGLKPGKPAEPSKGIAASGSKLELLVAWANSKGRTPIQDLILNTRHDKPMTNVEWIFSGSEFDTSFLTGEDVYIPDESRVVVSLTHNFGHLSVISCHHADAHDEHLWTVKVDLLPENLDTIITVTIKAAEAK